MILVLAGTKEAREVIHLLQNQGYKVMATTVGSYAKELILESDDIVVRDGALTADELEKVLIEESISLVVDATHPFAVRVSRMAMDTCKILQVPYVRFERGDTDIGSDVSGIVWVNSMEKAAAEVQRHSGRVFLTVGSNQLETFCRMLPLERIVARVLPQSGILRKCEALGLQPWQIIAMQGPFDKEINRNMFQNYQAGVIVTKESGWTGGAGEKIEAARELSIPIIVVRRPPLDYPLVARTTKELLELI